MRGSRRQAPGTAPPPARLEAWELLALARRQGLRVERHGETLWVRGPRAAARVARALRARQAEILALLPGPAPGPPATVWASVELDPVTVGEVLGKDAQDAHARAGLRWEVIHAAAGLEARLRDGRPLPPAPVRVRGRVLADWLPLGALARLLGLAGASDQPDR